MSPHNFLTCCFFSRSDAETGFGLKEIGGRRGPADTAVGTTMEKRERARCCCGCDCFGAATATMADLLPAAIEAHEDDEDEGSF